LPGHKWPCGGKAAQSSKGEEGLHFGWLTFNFCFRLVGTENGAIDIVQCEPSFLYIAMIVGQGIPTRTNLPGTSVNSTTTGFIIHVNTTPPLEIDFKKPTEWKRPQSHHANPSCATHTRGVCRYHLHVRQLPADRPYISPESYIR
jgi:hypothetical protein